MALRSTNTMSEALQKLLGTLSEMKVLPDADLEFIINIETQIVGKLREPIDRIAQMGLTNAPPQGAVPGGPIGGSAMSPGTPSPGMGATGLRSEPAMPNPDELRRLVQGA